MIVYFSRLIVSGSDGNIQLPKRKGQRTWNATLTRLSLHGWMDSRMKSSSTPARSWQENSEDFIEVPVWGIQKAMEEAYLLGRMTR